jgi:hypothetical protein
MKSTILARLHGCEMYADRKQVWFATTHLKRNKEGKMRKAAKPELFDDKEAISITM